MNVLITGGNGYIATSLKSALRQHHIVTSISRADFDLQNPHQTNKWFSNKYFDVVIHTAISGGSRLREDGYDVLDNNLQMYYNLIGNRRNFGRLINIGSGAELYQRDTPYGLSKHVIRQSLLSQPDFYNLRVFAVFDENELPTRFIKSSTCNYINRRPIVITQNKYMDFFYMKDFVNLVNYYIISDFPAKEADCAYKETPSLKEIAEKINSLGSHSVDVEYITDGLAQHYSATYPRTDIPVSVEGWELGVELTYEALCNR
jgi:nucleoside-diphosphate-sugar epimerase